MSYLHQQLFKIVKRKKITSEDLAILKKNAHVKSPSGINLLQSYLRSNSSFDENIADTLFEACGLGEPVTSNSTLEMIFHNRFDAYRIPILTWLTEKPGFDANVSREFVYKHLQHSYSYSDNDDVSILQKLWTPLDLSIVKHLVNKSLIDTTIIGYRTLDDPAYLFENVEDYAWFDSTFTLPAHSSYLQKNFFKVIRDADYYIHLFNSDPRYYNYEFTSIIFHHQPFHVLQIFLSKQRNFGENLTTHVIEGFRSHGFSTRAEDNLKQLIINGNITESLLKAFPRGIWNGLARQRDAYIDSICMKTSDTSYYCIFCDDTITRSGGHFNVNYKNNAGSIVFSKDGFMPFKEMMKIFEYNFKQPDAETVEKYKSEITKLLPVTQTTPVTC